MEEVVTEGQAMLHKMPPQLVGSPKAPMAVDKPMLPPSFEMIVTFNARSSTSQRSRRGTMGIVGGAVEVGPQTIQLYLSIMSRQRRRVGFHVSRSP